MTDEGAPQPATLALDTGEAVTRRSWHFSSGSRRQALLPRVGQTPDSGNGEMFPRWPAW